MRIYCDFYDLDANQIFFSSLDITIANKLKYAFVKSGCEEIEGKRLINRGICYCWVQNQTLSCRERIPLLKVSLEGKYPSSNTASGAGVFAYWKGKVMLRGVITRGNKKELTLINISVVNEKLLQKLRLAL